MRIEACNSIGLAIDFQERLVPVMYEKEKLIEASSILMAGLRAIDIPICVTQQYTKGLGNTIEEITDAIGDKTYIEKIKFSAYEDIKEEIAGKKFVIISGIEAHICVLQTITELSQAGYVPVLVADCISSRKGFDKEMALIRAKQEGAIITTCEAILFELLVSAGTDQSKKIQRLVK